MSKPRTIFLAIFSFIVVLFWIFPFFYIFITSFKTEETVVPPSLWIKSFTLENYTAVLDKEIFFFLGNSLVITISSVIFSILLGIPVSYSIVFGNIKKPNNLYFWFLSTFILPPVAVLIPATVILKNLGLLDTQIGLITMYTGTHMAIIIWLITTFFRDVPKELLEAATIDGSSKWYSFFSIILPMSRMGVISAGLLTFVFIWNESFFALNLTGSRANTLPVYMSTFLTQQGFFWARLSAISVVTVLPTIILGILSQKSLVRGLTAGAVKG